MGLSNKLSNCYQMCLNFIYCNFIQLLCYLPMTTNAIIIFILYLYTYLLLFLLLLLVLLKFIKFIGFVFIVCLLQLYLFINYSYLFNRIKFSFILYM